MNAPLHVLNVDGTTLALTRWDGVQQLRLSIAPVGKPSAGIEVTLPQMLDLARAVFAAAGHAPPERTTLTLPRKDARR